jgi:E3 ubiquitin-protein ligase DOA10
MECYVCLEGDGELAVHLCACTPGAVHPACLRKWMQTSQRTTCSVCGERYRFVQRRRHVRAALSIAVAALLYGVIGAIATIALEIGDGARVVVIFCIAGVVCVSVRDVARLPRRDAVVDLDDYALRV